ncbi:hypothetical protein S349_35 [Shewanella sp. phage 3/49]|uniref:hypothetical protein n=1 Tax=Shewanella sp. phage 3/49 TaxID=1458863 RepID=UPI0004F8F8AD|nr:hypothetical protein S349_35 [Shewanella sp. phage 3/49]AHK11825.1 hypothetical protein S349_35 [Shewanella sp. phage 3/49]
MKTPQEKAAELLPFVQALANGEKVMQSVDNGEELDSNGNFIYGLTYSIKPKMMLVNGFEVPEPMRVKPDRHKIYYTPHILAPTLFSQETWFENNSHKTLFCKGICHSTKEAAIAHAKAMLGIDPKVVGD